MLRGRESFTCGPGWLTGLELRSLKTAAVCRNYRARRPTLSLILGTTWLRSGRDTEKQSSPTEKVLAHQNNQLFVVPCNTLHGWIFPGLLNPERNMNSGFGAWRENKEGHTGVFTQSRLENKFTRTPQEAYYHLNIIKQKLDFSPLDVSALKKQKQNTSMSKCR